MQTCDITFLAHREMDPYKREIVLQIFNIPFLLRRTDENQGNTDVGGERATGERRLIIWRIHTWGARTCENKATIE